MKIRLLSAVALLGAMASHSVLATSACPSLPDYSVLHDALVKAQQSTDKNGGFGFNMWATIVNRDGIVCAVVMTGTNRGQEWPGSRVISAQKANTANAFSFQTLHCQLLTFTRLCNPAVLCSACKKAIRWMSILPTVVQRRFTAPLMTL